MGQSGIRDRQQTPFCCICLAALGIWSCIQTFHWYDTQSLFSYELKINPNSTIADHCLADAYLMAGDPAQALRDGTAMDRFRRLIAAQGGDLSVRLPIGSCSEAVTAGLGGTMGDIDAMAVGLAAWRLGAGRSRPGELVQPGAGIAIHRRPGQPVAPGEPLFTLYTDTPKRFESAMAELAAGWSIVDKPPARRPLIIDRINC